MLNGSEALEAAVKPRARRAAVKSRRLTVAPPNGGPMGGKRPDQYRIDRNEGRTTDHKFMPDEPGEGDVQDRLYSEVMEGSLKAAQPIAPDVLEPEAEAEHAKEMRREGKARAKAKPKRTRRRRPPGGS
jgi:hypothetical protein